MLYELVLITNLGVTTALATYPDFNSCLKERVQITQSHSAQFSVACLPTNSPEELEKKMNLGFKVLIDNITRLQESMEKANK
jgi:hypothetical protein